MKQSVVFAAFSLLFCTSLAMADHAHVNQKASEAYNSGDYTTAFKIWLNEAEKGDVIAQGRVGGMYAHGKGTEKNFSEAVNWYRMAANQGSLNAQFSLGSMYREGQGLKQSDIDAYAWFSVAAAKGNEVAQEEVKKLRTRMTPSQTKKAQSLAKEIWALIGWEATPLEFSESSK